MLPELQRETKANWLAIASNPVLDHGREEFAGAAPGSQARRHKRSNRHDRAGQVGVALRKGVGRRKFLFAPNPNET